jgi:uncharacterized protein (DUF1330 family)
LVLTKISITDHLWTQCHSFLPPAVSLFLRPPHTIKDPERWAEYRSKVPATIAPWGADLVCRGKWISTLCGEYNHADALVMSFPDADAINNWYNSLAYQALIPLREQAADVVLVSYESAS